jgi:hypothetical protein
MPFVDEILEGEIIEQYRALAAEKSKPKPETEPNTDVSPCTGLPNVCTDTGCATAGTTADCCTDDQKKKKKEYERRAAGWFDPPVAHRR